jgi:FAD/FMN-containing dehydrogenase
MSDVVERLKKLLGSHCITDPDVARQYMSDWRGLIHGNALCVVRPNSTQLLAQAVTLCHEVGVAMVPQGGNTGLVGAATPDASGTQVVVSTGGMRSIRRADPVDLSIVADAGATIVELQAAAEDAGAYFPLSFASEGTATLGGALATNAGGISAVRYGSARDLLLGIEAVLPDGRIWDGLRSLRKDNAGYALKQVLAGSEGTLGFITAATMKLVPAPIGREVAFCSLNSEDDVLRFWIKLRSAADGNIRAIEYLSGSCIDLAKTMGLRSPVESAPHYLLIELTSSHLSDDLKDLLEAFLADAMSEGVVVDAAIAQNVDQQKQFWRLREDQTEAQKRAGFNIKHDVSVPVAEVANLLKRCRSELEERYPEANVVPFGHVGDGNIHFNVVFPTNGEQASTPDKVRAVNEIVYGTAISLGGSFSAEHGIGQTKVGLLAAHRSAIELGLMRNLKTAFDPRSLMNPGKVLSFPKLN